jgi:hypothetical protein
MAASCGESDVPYNGDRAAMLHRRQRRCLAPVTVHDDLAAAVDAWLAGRL